MAMQSADCFRRAGLNTDIVLSACHFWYATRPETTLPPSRAKHKYRSTTVSFLVRNPAGIFLLSKL